MEKNGTFHMRELSSRNCMILLEVSKKLNEQSEDSHISEEGDE